jgi:hypothetical protein
MFRILFTNMVLWWRTYCGMVHQRYPVQRHAVQYQAYKRFRHPVSAPDLLAR